MIVRPHKIDTFSQFSDRIIWSDVRIILMQIVRYVRYLWGDGGKYMLLYVIKKKSLFYTLF